MSCLVFAIRRVLLAVSAALMMGAACGCAAPTSCAVTTQAENDAGRAFDACARLGALTESGRYHDAFFAVQPLASTFEHDPEGVFGFEVGRLSNRASFGSPDMIAGILNDSRVPRWLKRELVNSVVEMAGEFDLGAQLEVVAAWSQVHGGEADVYQSGY
ncbi:MAG: hypothetical protein K2Q20_14230 [Phycisphaerales bacterium]|nr:hypothetical protein [Phycisphaerales bacterium]